MSSQLDHELSGFMHYLLPLGHCSFQAVCTSRSQLCLAAAVTHVWAAAISPAAWECTQHTHVFLGVHWTKQNVELQTLNICVSDSSTAQLSWIVAELC